MSSLKPYLILSREEARSFKKATGFPRRRNQVPCNQPVEVPHRSKTLDDRVHAGGKSGPPGQLSTAAPGSPRRHWQPATNLPRAVLRRRGGPERHAPVVLDLDALEEISVHFQTRFKRWAERKPPRVVRRKRDDFLRRVWVSRIGTAALVAAVPRSSGANQARVALTPEMVCGRK